MWGSGGTLQGRVTCNCLCEEGNGLLRGRKKAWYREKVHFGVRSRYIYIHESLSYIPPLFLFLRNIFDALVDIHIDTHTHTGKTVMASHEATSANINNSRVNKALCAFIAEIDSTTIQQQPEYALLKFLVKNMFLPFFFIIQ